VLGHRAGEPVADERLVGVREPAALGQDHREHRGHRPRGVRWHVGGLDGRAQVGLRGVELAALELDPPRIPVMTP
jgi:hypothetical protein